MKTPPLLAAVAEDIVSRVEMIEIVCALARENQGATTLSTHHLHSCLMTRTRWDPGLCRALVLDIISYCQERRGTAWNSVGLRHG